MNRAGFGFAIVSASVNRILQQLTKLLLRQVNGTTTRDNVTAGGLTVDEQPIGQMKTTKYFDVPKPSHPHQGQGIIGFAGPKGSNFQPKSNSWFWNLCAEKKLKVCKLGLLFGESETLRLRPPERGVYKVSVQVPVEKV